MKTAFSLLRLVLYGLFGYVLFTAEVDVSTWQFWALLGILIVVDLLSAVQEDLRKYL